MQKNLYLIPVLLVCLNKIQSQELIREVNIPGTEVYFQLRLIPGGTFEAGKEDREEGRAVQLDSFYMGVHEVTYDEFIVFYQRAYDGDTTAHPDHLYDADAVARPTPQYIDYTYGMGKSGFPAVSMTQQAALRYCRWLYEKTGEFYRLPTEAEWEYACRAGLPDEVTTKDLKERAWYYDNSFEKYHEVGTRLPNAWGLYDMLGNVAEWTLDYYQKEYLKNEPGDPVVNPWTKPERRHSRTVKGGSYDSEASDCRCSARQKSLPLWQARDPQIPKSLWWNPDSPFVGFRLVKPLKKLSKEEVVDFFEQAIKD